jgi:transketolase
MSLTIEQLQEKSRLLRINILKMINLAGSGHPGGSLSAIDILCVLFNNILRHNSSTPCWDKRDRFILSKGHACPALYAVLADCGYFPEHELFGLRKFGCRLQGHPCMDNTPGLEASTGSLGQGLSIAAGIALGEKSDHVGYRVYAMMGDGELQEGQIWEAAMTAGHYQLDNLCGIVDSNKLQIDGSVERVMNIEPLRNKWLAFNWHVIEIDGHNFQQIENAFLEAENQKGKPTVIIAHTVKGKGVSFMEGEAGWHGVAPNQEQLEKALVELMGEVKHDIY